MVLSSLGFNQIFYHYSTLMNYIMSKNKNVWSFSPDITLRQPLESGITLQIRTYSTQLGKEAIVSASGASYREIC
jgi:hypothetical protein